MRRDTSAAAALLGAVLLLGAQNRAPVAAPPPPGEHPPAVVGVDRTFALAATQGNHAEIAAATLALERSHTDEVRGYAQKMLDEHAQIAADAVPLVPKLVPPAAAQLSATDTLALDYLRTLPAVDFDQQYAMLQVGDHLATITAFATEARDGANPQLKAFAKKWLPTIQAHLGLAIDTARHIGGDSPLK